MQYPETKTQNKIEKTVFYSSLIVQKLLQDAIVDFLCENWHIFQLINEIESFNSLCGNELGCIGRFITIDPIQSGTNWYVYCNNRPLTMVDPTGLEPSYAGMDSNYYYSGNKTPFFGNNKRFSQTQKDLVGKKYVWGGNDPVVDGGVDCSGAILYGLKKLGYSIPDTNAEGIIENITKPVKNGEYTEGSIRALHDEDDNSVFHVQTLLEDGRVNPTGDSNNDIDNPGEINKLSGTLPASGTLHELDWKKIEKNYGEKEYIDSWQQKSPKE